MVVDAAQSIVRMLIHIIYFNALLIVVNCVVILLVIVISVAQTVVGASVVGNQFYNFFQLLNSLVKVFVAKSTNKESVMICGTTSQGFFGPFQGLAIPIPFQTVNKRNSYKWLLQMRS